MKMNIKPLADRVLVKPAEAEMKTAGGIIIPDTAKEKPQKGTIVAVGPYRHRQNAFWWSWQEPLQPRIGGSCVPADFLPGADDHLAETHSHLESGC